MPDPMVEVFFSALTEMPTEFLQCRGMKHKWEESDPLRIVNIDREADRRMRGGERVFAERELTCERCTMRRRDAYRITSWQGHTLLSRIGASYAAPPGYAIRGGGQQSTGLVLGLMLDQSTNVTPIKRARKGR